MTAPNPFVWYELTTTDLDAADAFYRAVLGWDTRPWDGDGPRYLVATASGAPVAGLTALPPDAGGAEAGPVWLGHVAVEDVDDATRRWAAAGGRVDRVPEDVPGIGRFSAVADPGGAPLLLFQPVGGEPPAAPPGSPGHVGWRELRAADGAAAFAFHAEQFGWTKSDALDMGPMGTYQLFAAGGEAIGGMMTGAPGMAPSWLYYFGVPALDAAAARVAEAGGRVLEGPHPVPGGGWIVHARDPQGALFALVAPER